jgi:hypothetical protein
MEDPHLITYKPARFAFKVLLQVALLSVIGTMPAGKLLYQETSHGFFPCDIWRVSRGYHWVSQDFYMKKVVPVLMPWKPSGVAHKDPRRTYTKWSFTFYKLDKIWKLLCAK